MDELCFNIKWHRCFRCPAANSVICCRHHPPSLCFSVDSSCTTLRDEDCHQSFSRGDVFFLWRNYSGTRMVKQWHFLHSFLTRRAKGNLSEVIIKTIAVLWLRGRSRGGWKWCILFWNRARVMQSLPHYPRPAAAVLPPPTHCYTPAISRLWWSSNSWGHVSHFRVELVHCWCKGDSFWSSSILIHWIQTTPLRPLKKENAFAATLMAQLPNLPLG